LSPPRLVTRRAAGSIDAMILVSPLISVGPVAREPTARA
jgi:hypothetical protein